VSLSAEGATTVHPALDCGLHLFGPRGIAVYALVGAIVAFAVHSQCAQAEQGLAGDAAVCFALSALVHA
jgi:hypothetical protein